MVKPYKGRKLTSYMVVEIYRNLGIKGAVVYSVRDAKTKLVLAHVTEGILTNCQFRVSQAGRQRVIEQRKKNVHAWIRGEWVSPMDYETDHLRAVAVYNPYQNWCFTSEDGTAVHESSLVVLDQKGIRYL